jgi:hypothetical protein
MSAVIKASGEQFDVDAFLAGCTLPVWRVYRRGERRFPGSQTNKDQQTASGVHVIASGADFDEFPKQVAEATEFLRAQAKQLLRLRSFPGVQVVNIDFGVERRDVAIQCDYLTPELVGLAGSLGMGIGFSIYPGQWETSEAQPSGPANGGQPSSPDSSSTLPVAGPRR